MLICCVFAYNHNAIYDNLTVSLDAFYDSVRGIMLACLWLLVGTNIEHYQRVLIIIKFASRLAVLPLDSTLAPFPKTTILSDVTFSFLISYNVKKHVEILQQTREPLKNA